MTFGERIGERQMQTAINPMSRTRASARVGYLDRSAASHFYEMVLR